MALHRDGVGLAIRANADGDPVLDETPNTGSPPGAGYAWRRFRDYQCLFGGWYR